MNFWIGVFLVALGYAIGFCRGWMRGVEETRVYIDTRRGTPAQRATVVDDLTRSER